MATTTGAHSFHPVSISAFRLSGEIIRSTGHDRRPSAPPIIDRQDTGRPATGRQGTGRPDSGLRETDRLATGHRVKAPPASVRRETDLRGSGHRVRGHPDSAHLATDLRGFGLQATDRPALARSAPADRQCARRDHRAPTPGLRIFAPDQAHDLAVAIAEDLAAVAEVAADDRLSFCEGTTQMNKMISMFAAALFLLPATASKSRADALQDALSRGNLRVGVAAESLVPWLATDKTGARIGFEIDVATSVSDALGVPAEFVEVPYDDLPESLNAGKVDVVISGVTVTAERARDVFFSSPYATTDFTVVVDKTNLPAGAAEKGYDIKGMKIGVAWESLAEYAASTVFQAAEIVNFDNNGLLRDAFLDGTVQGLIAPTPYPTFIVSRDPDRYAMEPAPLLSTVQAMAVRPDSPRLLNFLNAWIVENKANGALGDMTAYWFKGSEWLDNLEGYDPGAEETGAGTDEKAQ